MGTKIAARLLVGLCLLILFSPESGTASIGNIKEFLNTCPKSDPVYNKIKNDFTIRRNGIVVPLDTVSCSEPASSLPLAQFTDELILLQALRVMYYMDLGQSGHLPWTSGTLYQWMKSKIRGFNIDDSLVDFGGKCCATFPDGLYITVGSDTGDDSNRDYHRKWIGVAALIGLYAHEVRHLNGPGHDCHWDAVKQIFTDDNDYNISNISSFGTQYWLEKSWLTGDIHAGFSCLSPAERTEIIDWHAAAISGFRDRFCNIKPPAVAMPATPGGSCQVETALPWQVQAVDSALDFGQYVSTAIDPGTNIPYLSYFDATGGHLRLAKQVTTGGNCGPDSTWSCRTIDANPQVGKYSSIDIFKSGTDWKLGIAYIDETNHALKYYGYSCSSGFCTRASSQAIDAALNPTRYTSLKFDANGSPHIAYQGLCGANCSELKYASYVGSGGNCGAGKWSCTTVKNVAHAQYGLYPSLALNGSNEPRIAHYDAYFGNLDYAWRCGSGSCGNCGPGNTWQCDVMDSAGDVGLFPSLHVDKGASDNARIAYYDRTNGKLKHVTIPGTIGNCGPLFFGVRVWQCDAIADMGAGLQGYAGISLGVDPTGRPLIAYMDASGAQGPVRLRVARPASLPGSGNCGPIANWTCDTIDGGDSWTNEGGFASLAFNSTGEPVVAYYEEDNYYDGNLKVAFRSEVSPDKSFLYFPHVATTLGWQTEIAIINTSGQTVSGTLRAFSNGGQPLETKPVTLSAHGRTQGSVANLFANHANIGYIIFDANSDTIQGYTKFYREGAYRAAIPAVKEANASEIYIPHIASDAEWWTGISLVNTTSSQKVLTITFNTGQVRTVILNANEHKAFDIASLFNNQPQPGIASAVITNPGGVIGLELFGRTNNKQLDGILLTDRTTSTLYYPHVAGGEWWTGIVAYNPSALSCEITITPYSVQGTPLTVSTRPLAGKGKYVGSVAALGLPAQTAWVRIDSTRPLSGFELFSTVDGEQLAPYAGGGGTGAKVGVFAKIEKSGWTGIAFVNTEAGQASVTLTAYADTGAAIATQTLSIGGHAKVVRLADAIFPQDTSSATYIAYASDRNVVGFQLNGNADWTMLDGLPALGDTN